MKDSRLLCRAVVSNATNGAKNPQPNEASHCGEHNEDAGQLKEIASGMIARTWRLLRLRCGRSFDDYRQAHLDRV